MRYPRQYYKHAYDENSFVFNLRSNGRLSQSMKFSISNQNESIYMYPNNSYWLISIGSDGIRNGVDDITIMKANCQHMSPGNGCCQQSYSYNGIQNALCGSNQFDVKQFFVIQFE